MTSPVSYKEVVQDKKVTLSLNVFQTSTGRTYLKRCNTIPPQTQLSFMTKRKKVTVLLPLKFLENHDNVVQAFNRSVFLLITLTFDTKFLT
jgi:hypothetical protein